MSIRAPVKARIRYTGRTEIGPADDPGALPVHWLQEDSIHIASTSTPGAASRLAARLVALLGIVAALACAAPARAVHGDFLGETFGYNSLRKGELECELFPELQVSPRGSVRGWQGAELGYGLSNRLGFESRFETVYRKDSPNLDGLHFAAVELGLRYRFAERGAWPVNVTAQLEFEHETPAANGGERENNFMPRVSLSRDFGKRLNAVANIGLKHRSFGIPKYESRPALPDSLTVQYALAAAYAPSEKLQLAAEFRHEPAFHLAAIYPQAWYWLDKEVGIKLATGFGLTDKTDDFVLRGSVEFEIDL